MSDQIHPLRVGDTGRPIDAILESEDGTPRDLAGCSVEAWLTNLDTRAVRTVAATVVDAAAGRVRYTPDATDVAAPARLRLVWVVTGTDSKLSTYPSEGGVGVFITNR